MLRGLVKFAAAVSRNAKNGTANRSANLFANSVLVRIPYYLDTQTLISLRVWPTVVVDGFKKNLLREIFCCGTLFGAGKNLLRPWMVREIACCWT